MISLAVAAAGWVGVISPGDYAAFKFPPTPRHDLEQVVPRSNIHYGLYEALFDGESGSDELASLARFLDLPVQPEKLARRVQPSGIGTQQGDNKLTSEVLAEVVRFYAEVYAFCRLRFPETRDLWPGNRILAEQESGDMQSGA